MVSHMILSSDTTKSYTVRKGTGTRGWTFFSYNRGIKMDNSTLRFQGYGTCIENQKGRPDVTQLFKPWKQNEIIRQLKMFLTTSQ